jgi:predicted phosphoribosyltransferase/predicted alpha/beta-hydrolase family hydrolase
MIFRDRIDAGRRLAEAVVERLGEDRSPEGVVVLGLPRGGVPVAAQVAAALHAPLDVLVVRKLGVPRHREYAMGAIGELGVRILDGDVIRAMGVTDEQLAQVDAAERSELERRARRYRGTRQPLPLVGRTAVIVDDGMATGSTALAATQVARLLGASGVVLAVPVASAQAVAALRRHADEVVAVAAPSDFRAVGQFYEHFDQTSDDEVVRLLTEFGDGHRSAGAEASGPAAGVRHLDVGILDGEVTVGGRLTVPDRARGVVLFAHGSGSSRHSPRNQAVADALNRAGLATLLFDLLTPAEADDRTNVFDVELLERRLLAATRWVVTQPETASLELGYFGASTGAGAALLAAAESEHRIAAVVSRGGRPDLAGDRLPQVTAPTLLIVGGRDPQVLQLNETAAARLHCEHRVAVVPGAGHLFEEPGTLDTVTDLATEWFVHHLAAAYDLNGA